jgi:two-component system CAI-1 autoinducer sensor kinase/phosphatase CqsS
MSSPFLRFQQELQANAKASEQSIVVAGALGTIVFGVYGALWLYVTPLAHESLPLRLIGMLACLGLWTSPRWPGRHKKYLPWLWFGTVSYALPFFSTYQLLASNYSLLRSMIEVSTLIFVIVIFPSRVLSILSMTIGVVLGVLAAYVTYSGFWDLNHAIVKSVHLPAMLYCIVAGMIFTRTHLKGQLNQEKIATLKSLIGSIAHELKSPLAQLSYRMDSMSHRLPGHVVGVASQTISVTNLETLYTEIAKSKDAIQRGTQISNMILDEISEKPIDRSGMRILSAGVTTLRAAEEFIFPNPAHRFRVSVTAKSDFSFKGEETRYIFALFNLMKNAVYYFDRHPDATMSITVGDHIVTVEDTGPGMSPEVLSRAFEAFYSSGKPGGTGLGLSFCKRTMSAFGGSITCESRPGAYTRFVMHFPRIRGSELAANAESVKKQAMEVFAGKRILIVDDDETLRRGAIATLAPLGAQIDEAENGATALEMLALHRYTAMLLDLNMPVMDGYTTAERVRKGAVPGQEHLAIVVHSAESPHAARVRLERIGVTLFLSKGAPPLDMMEALHRAHSLAQSQHRTFGASKKLWGKTILLADDEAFNRKYLGRMLNERGFHAVEANDGQSALELLKDPSRRIDAVVTDIFMPGLDGLAIARAIRSLPSPLRDTPVIGLSAHVDDAMVSEARASGINEFLAKPVTPLELFHKLNQLLGTDAADAVAEELSAPQLDGPWTVTHQPPRGLLNTARLESLRRVGFAGVDFVQAMNEMLTKLDRLAHCLAASDLCQAQALLHALVGLAGQLGAQAFYEETRVRYVQILESGQWPPDGEWLAQLRTLFTDTERVMKAHFAG